MAPRECTIECSGFLTVARLGAGGENTDSADLSMAKRPTTLDCTAFPVPVPVGRNAGARRTETTKQISRTWSLPAVPCRRRRRRCSSGRRLPARARSTCAGLRDRELRAGNRKPEVEFSPEVGRSRSATDVSELSSSEATSRSVFCSSDVTATTSFQTCFHIKPEVEFSPEVGRSRSTSDVVELSSSDKSSRSVICSGDVTATTSFQMCFHTKPEVEFLPEDSRSRCLPVVPCRRRRRRCSGRRLSGRARSTCAGLRDHELRAGNCKPEVEFSPEVGRSRSASDVVELSSSEKSSRSVCCSGDVTATTSFQTCFDEDDEGPALTTSSADTDQPITVLEEPSPRCRGGGLASVTSVVNAAVGLRPPRHDGHRLCPPASASRDRRSASVGTVRPSTIARSRFNNVGADFGETDVPVDQSIVVPIGVGDGVGTGGTPVPPNSGKKHFRAIVM